VVGADSKPAAGRVKTLIIGELAPHYLGIRNSYPPRDARNHVIRKLRNARSCAMRIAHAIMWIT
jgi:hypothetical protein